MPGATVRPRSTSVMAVCVDYDGTLAPIVDDPTGASPAAGAVDALRTLVACHPTAVVSGRPVRFLAAHLPVAGLVVYGQYGLEHATLTEHGLSEVETDARVEPFRAAVTAAEADAHAAGWPDVEHKDGVACTIHWRAHAARAAEGHALAQQLAQRHGLVVLHARAAAELRPPITVDKTNAMLDFATRSGATQLVVIGDDLADAHAIRGVRRALDANTTLALRAIAVRSDETPDELIAVSDELVEGPEGVIALLAELAAQ